MTGRRLSSSSSGGGGGGGGTGGGGGVTGVDLSDPKQLAEFAKYLFVYNFTTMIDLFNC
jgi:hypothetical protein